MNIINTVLLGGLLIFTTSCNHTNTTNNSEDKKSLNKNIEIPNSYFTDTVWLLDSLNDKKIEYPADYSQNYIVFSGESQGFTIEGFGGCNNFTGKYDVGDHNTIGIDKITFPKKTCSFNKLETTYFNMLKSISRYKISGFYLFAFNGDKKIATFKDAKELRTH